MDPHNPGGIGKGDGDEITGSEQGFQIGRSPLDGNSCKFALGEGTEWFN